MREIKLAYVRNFPKYLIGNDGSVWSNDYNHSGLRREMRQYPDKDGYLYIFFVVSGKRIKKMTHRLVAEHFLTQPTKEHQVNHKNGKRQDNRVENLEWVTSQENCLHGWRVNGRKASKKQIENGRKLAKITNKKRWNHE